MNAIRMMNMSTRALVAILHLACVKATVISQLPLANAFKVSCAAPLSITSTPAGLRGVFTSEAVTRGDRLLSIPLQSCLTVPRGAEDDVDLAMALIDAIETDEPWIAYCKDYLPRSTNAAIIWDEDEIDELQIPAVVEQAQALSERCIDTYKERFKATEADDEAEEADEKLGSNGAAGRSRTPSLDEWKWAFSMVYSRSFSLEESRDGGKGPLRAMAPFVDMFNHVPESPAEYAAQYDAWEAAGYDEPPSPWRLERAGQAADESAADYVVSLYADRAVASGEEIRVPYGIETTGECLCTSGFVPDDNSADYATIFADPVEVRASLPAHTAL